MTDDWSRAWAPPTTSGQEVLTVHDLDAMLRRLPTRPPNTIFVSLATMHEFRRQVRIWKRREKRKVTMKRRRAIGRARW